SLVLTASKDGTAKLWNALSGERLRTFSGQGFNVRCAVFSADDSSVLAASFDGTAKLWDVASGECTQTMSCHDYVHSAVFSADGLSILTASFLGMLN
ncbi:unnamed protein product, partial [Polarella glacialis]